jgi:hypothetical protein
MGEEDQGSINEVDLAIEFGRVVRTFTTGTEVGERSQKMCDTD